MRKKDDWYTTWDETVCATRHLQLSSEVTLLSGVRQSDHVE